MTAESPFTLDLTEDITTQTELQLTPQEQASYRAYIETLEATERDTIISLTQRELQDLKSILENFDPRENAAGETIASFIDTQKAEGISSSDILVGVEGNLLTPEILDTFDSLSKEVLFGAEGMFRDLDISETAQDVSSTSFSFVILEAIKNQPETLAALVTAYESGDTSQIQPLVETLGGENMTQIGVHLRNMEDEDGNPYRIKGNGEQNKIFMDMQIGTDFFKKVLGGEVTFSNIYETINAQNSDVPLEVQMGDIAALQEMASFTQADIDAITDAINTQGNQETPDDGVVTPAVPGGEGVVPPFTAPEAEAAANELADMKPLGPFLAAILEFLKGITALHQDGSETAETETAQEDRSAGDVGVPSVETTTEGRETQIQNLIGMVENLQIENIEKDLFIQELRGNPELANRLLDALEGISTDENYEESFKILFGRDGLDGTGNEIYILFESHGIFTSLPDGTSQSEKIILLVEEYARYRNSPGVIGQTDNRTTWEAYAQQRKQEGWLINTTP